MAKVSSPFKSEDARGSVGSLTATGWRSIKILRRRANPTNKQTTRQMVVRNTLSLISRTWQTESASDRQSWSDYAQSHPQTNSLGQSFTPTPANAYLGLNFLALDMSKPAVSTAPTTPPPASVVGVVESGAPTLPLTGGYEVTMTVLGSAVAGDCIEVQVSRGFDSIARNAQPSDYRHYAYIAGNLTSTTLSGLTIGKYYWSRYRYIDATGQATPWVKVQAEAQAGT
jgi:hypothetical protein